MACPARLYQAVLRQSSKNSSFSKVRAYNGAPTSYTRNSRPTLGGCTATTASAQAPTTLL